MKAKILAAYLMEHPDLEILIDHHTYGLVNIKPSISTSLYCNITDSTGEKIIVKQDDDFILIEKGEL